MDVTALIEALQFTERQWRDEYSTRRHSFVWGNSASRWNDMADGLRYAIEEVKKRNGGHAPAELQNWETKHRCTCGAMEFTTKMELRAHIDQLESPACTATEQLASGWSWHASEVRRADGMTTDGGLHGPTLEHCARELLELTDAVPERQKEEEDR